MQLHFNKGIGGAAPEAIAATHDTATNPEVTEAFTLVIVADGEGSAYPGEARSAMNLAAAHKDARNIDLATAELRKIAPHSGSYVSESNFSTTRGSRSIGERIIPSCGASRRGTILMDCSRPPRRGQ